MKKILFVFISLIISTLLYSQKSLHSDSIDVLHYDIRLDISDFKHKKISGNTALKIAPKVDNVSSISLDLLKMKVSDVFFNEKKLELFYYNDTLLNIPLPRAMNKRDTFEITVFYSGFPERDKRWGGFFFTDTHAFNMGVGMAAEPHAFGRVWYPCVDDFIDRAGYDFYITVADKHTAVCGGLLQKESKLNNGKRLFHWRLDQEIPTYLSSVAVSNYVGLHSVYQGLERPIPVSIYVTPELKENAEISFANLHKTARTFEEKFGVYVWQRIGYVSAPRAGGAMEHATNITCYQSAIDGTLSKETLFAHELSHHWFGDLVTCKTASDMWLNEGWASYSEAIFKENLYGYESFKKYVRDNHESVLRTTYVKDQGYRAVSGVPHDFTYGSTVYDKGADVAHTLRGYLGDSLFFSGVQAYLQHFAFANASSEDMRDFLSEFTKVDLTNFFDAWVFDAGFPHFSVDSFSVKKKEQLFETEVFIRQKLLEREKFAKKNRVEITFMGKNWERQTKLLEFSGETAVQTFQLSFEPILAMPDLEEKIADATTDSYLTIRKKGSYLFEKQHLNIDVKQLRDSVFIRVTQHWIAPDNFKREEEKISLCGYRYWQVNGLLSTDFQADAEFIYNRDNMLDSPFFTDADDPLILLYRRDTADDWHEIEFTRDGDYMSGVLKIKQLKIGEYVLGLKPE